MWMNCSEFSDARRANAYNVKRNCIVVLLFPHLHYFVHFDYPTSRRTCVYTSCTSMLSEINRLIVPFIIYKKNKRQIEHKN